MDEIELIKEKINIVDLVAEYLPLKKAGVNFRANCPFHQEKTPSFMVSPERGIYHCFGCSKSGDIYKFVMEKEGLEFKDALELLANKAGVVLKRGKSDKGKSERDRFYEANQKAAQFYNYLLLEHLLGKKALEYLKKRGLTEETIKTFQIGYAPQSWETLTKFLKKRGFTSEEIIGSGLGVQSRQGGYDRFRGRIIFPLIDVQKRVIGFSGRVLGVGEPKYINTPQTLIFDKSKFLLGLHLSKGEISQKKEAILVEGEMDMIMSYQAGVKNIVASKGTALTEGQLDLLKKYTETLSLCFDTDLAGDAASRRGIELADQKGFNLKVIQVKGSKDPADTILKDPKDWQESVETAEPIYDYYLSSVAKRFNSKTAQGKKEIMGELMPILNKITDPMVKEHYIQKLSSLLLVKDDLVREELKKVNTSYKPAALSINVKDRITVKEKNDVVIQSTDRRQRLEEYLIALMLHLPPNHFFVPKFPETIFITEYLKQIYVMLVLFLDSISFKGASFKISEFVKTLPPELTEVVDRLYLMEIDDKLSAPTHWQKEIDMVVSELKKMLIKASLEKLSLQIKNAQEFEKVEQLDVLNKRFRDLSVKLKNL
jgi:DNA primase